MKNVVTSKKVAATTKLTTKIMVKSLNLFTSIQKPIPQNEMQKRIKEIMSKLEDCGRHTIDTFKCYHGGKCWQSKDFKYGQKGYYQLCQ